MTSETQQKILDLVDQLAGSVSPEMISFLDYLSCNTTPATDQILDETNEGILIHIIRSQLPPADQERMTYLHEKQEAIGFDGEEHQEFLQYLQRLQRADIDRLAAMIQLARLRQIPLKTVIAEFSAGQASSS